MLRLILTRRIFSILCILLLAVPMAERLQHELSHLDDVHCSIKARHYCQQEEQCPVCDYLSGTPAYEDAQNHTITYLKSASCNTFFSCTSYAVINQHSTALLRGPPTA